MPAAVVLRLRDRAYRRIAQAERQDTDGDGIPDFSTGAGIVFGVRGVSR
ncbi:hypothetical protein ACFQZ4_49755 [Catellatospora coxensis]